MTSSQVQVVGDIQFLLWPWGVLSWHSLRRVPFSSPLPQCFLRWVEGRATSASFSFSATFWSSCIDISNVAKHHLQNKKCQTPPVPSWQGSATFGGFPFCLPQRNVADRMSTLTVKLKKLRTMLLIQLPCWVCASFYLSWVDFTSYNFKENRKGFSELSKCWECKQTSCLRASLFRICEASCVKGKVPAVRVLYQFSVPMCSYSVEIQALH